MVAAAVHPKILALVHFGSRYTSTASHVRDAKKFFDGEISAPTDLSVIEIPFSDR
jgi:ribonuclease Z